jgi:hypothetical protein
VIVNRHLAGRHAAWAVVGAFGDNLDETARFLAQSLPLSTEEIHVLKRLGTALNYNAYGEREEDLHFPPAELHRRLRSHADPLAFAHEDSAYAVLCQGYEEDLSRAKALAPYAGAAGAAVYVLPDAAWARRVSGVLAGRLARSARARAHAVLSPLSTAGWQVSVRSPLERPRGAAAFCQRFSGGGGREAAGGINCLAPGDFDRFVAEFLAHFAETPAVVSD